MLAYYLTTLSIVPLLISRAFIPLFATACFARWGAGLDVGWLGAFESYSGVQLLAHIPAWATDDATLLILGIMAAVELAIQKAPETREILGGYTDATLKAIGAGLISFLMVEGDLRELVGVVVQEGDITSFRWGQSFQYTWSFGIGACVWFFAATRMFLYEFLHEADPQDDIGLQAFLSWAEDGVGFIGVFFFILLPPVAVVASALALLALFLTRAALEAREEGSKVPCAHCEESVLPCALACAGCRNDHGDPQQVTVLGVVTNNAVVNREEHRLELVSRRRCPSCAERLKDRSVEQRCTACATPVFADRAALDRFLDHVGDKVPRTLLISFCLGLIPIIGLIPGVIYYRLSLISSLRGYVSRTRSFMLRWGLRIFAVIVVSFQAIPLVGGLMIPILCLANYTLSRRAVARQHITGTTTAGPGTPALIGGAEA